jgi:hypothetical protein
LGKKFDKFSKIQYYDTGCYTDQIFVVHDYDNFYGLDYNNGQIYTSSWDNLNSKGLNGTIFYEISLIFPGEIICMCESWGYAWGSGLRRLYWDPVSQTVKNEPILSDAGIFHSHFFLNFLAGSISNVGIWEHGCFSRGGSANVLPGGFSFCYYSNKDSSYGKLSAVKLSDTITHNWGISGVPTSITFPATGLPTATDGYITIAFVQDSGNSFYLQIVNSAAGNFFPGAGIV